MNNPLDVAGLTMAFASAGVTMGTTTTVTIGAAAPFCINGKAYVTVAANNTAVTSMLDPNTGIAPVGVGAQKGCIFLALATSAGTVATLRFVQSEIVDLEADSAAYTAGAFKTNPEWPSVPEGYCPIGYFVVKVASDYTAGAKHVFGTTSVATGAMNSAATAYAITATSICALPARPQAS